jgi:glycosyltransferase involved in cell wall biosynthesis
LGAPHILSHDDASIHHIVSAEAVLPELARHDACLVPSVWLETGPLAVYEAMAAGLPVIGSRLGCIDERIGDNVDGLLFRPGDAEELAGIIPSLWHPRARCIGFAEIFDRNEPSMKWPVTSTGFTGSVLLILT